MYLHVKILDCEIVCFILMSRFFGWSLPGLAEEVR